jgi:hypothetical protein
LRLFRQRDHGEWGDVIQRLTDALEARIGERHGLYSADRGPARIAASPLLTPIAAFEAKLRDGISRVAETRMGLVQHFPDGSDASESVAAYGEYLQPLLDTLPPFVKPGMTAMEVGAGVGIHALWLSRALGADGHVLLYEPDARRRQVLKQNLSANDVTNATVMRRSLRGESVASPTQLETIDDLRLARLDLLKINDAVDPATVLQGAVDTLWRLRPALCVTLNDTAAMDALIAHAKNFGYACWVCEAPLFDPANFNLRTDDVFAGRTSLSLFALPEERGATIAWNSCVTAHA